MRKSVHNNESGLGQAIVIILVVIVIAAIGVIGWRILDKNKTTVASTPVAKATNTACLKVYNDTNLCNAAAVSSGFAKLAYTAVDTNTSPQGTTSSVTIKNGGNGNTAISTSSGGQSYNTIQIGNTTYVKDQTDNNWTKYTSNAPTVTNPASDIKTEFSTKTTPAAQQIKYTYLGKDSCGNATCFKYQVIDPANPGTTYVWFNDSNYRLQRFSTKNSSGTNDFVITYGNVSISAPSPVVSAASASSGASAAGAPTAAQIQAAEQQAEAAASKASQ